MLVRSYKFNIGGKELVLRNPRKEDAEKILEGAKIISSESKFVERISEDFAKSPEEEMERLNEFNNSDIKLFLAAFVDGEYVGRCYFKGRDHARCRHRNEMSIALMRKYTGMGIGRIMLDTLIEISKEHGFEQMELEVTVDNDHAIAMYQRMGFKIYGTLPRNMKYKDGTYADIYWMMKIF